MKLPIRVLMRCTLVKVVDVEAHPDEPDRDIFDRAEALARKDYDSGNLEGWDLTLGKAKISAREENQ